VIKHASNWSVIVVAAVSATLIYAGKRFPLTASSIAPAAEGSVEIWGTECNNE
jgi:hypothetical protein